MTLHSYTEVDTECDIGNIISCNDCGAFASRKEDVVHYDTCKPGESEYWQKIHEPPPIKCEDCADFYYCLYHGVCIFKKEELCDLKKKYALSY